MCLTLICFTGFMFYFSYLCIFTYSGVKDDVDIRWCSCHLTVQLQVPPFLGTRVHLSLFFRVAQSLFFSLVFCLLLFSVGYCIVCPFSI